MTICASGQRRDAEKLKNDGRDWEKGTRKTLPKVGDRVYMKIKSEERPHAVPHIGESAISSLRRAFGITKMKGLERTQNRSVSSDGEDNLFQDVRPDRLPSLTRKLSQR